MPNDKTDTTELPLLSRIKTLTDEIIGFFDDNALPDAAGIYLPRKTDAKKQLEAIIARALGQEQHMRSVSFKAGQEDQITRCRVVPDEPTPEMIKVAQDAYEQDYEYGLTDKDIIAVYKAMIKEAP